VGATQSVSVNGIVGTRLGRLAPAIVSLVVFFTALAVLRSELRHVTWVELMRDTSTTRPNRLGVAVAARLSGRRAHRGSDPPMHESA